MRWTSLALIALLATPAGAGEREDELLKAVRKGDAAAVKALLDGGVSPNAKYRYDRPILSFAADRGNREIVGLLLERGAEVNAKDSYYKSTALISAVQAGHVEVVEVMLAKGAEPPMAVLGAAMEKENPGLARVAAASGKIAAEHLSGALTLADRDGKKELAEAFRSAGVKPLPPTGFTMAPETLARFAGIYKEPAKGWMVNLTVENGALRFVRSWPPTVFFEPTGATTFRAVDSDGVATVRFDLEGDRPKVLTMVTPSDGEIRFERVEDAK